MSVESNVDKERVSHHLNVNDRNSDALTGKKKGKTGGVGYAELKEGIGGEFQANDSEANFAYTIKTRKWESDLAGKARKCPI